MKKAVIFFSVLALVVALGGMVRAQDEEAAAPLSGKVVYTLTDEQDINTFNTLIQRRAVISTRIAVLSDYLNLEKANLEQVETQLYLKYQVDPKKNYTYDPSTKQIRELSDTVPAVAPPAQ